jgi:hypothetical protein
LEHLRRTVKLRSTTAANLFVVMNLVQFHWLFYASRTLPNFTAMPFGEITVSLLGVVLAHPGLWSLIFSSRVRLLTHIQGSHRKWETDKQQAAYPTDIHRHRFTLMDGCSHPRRSRTHAACLGGCA